MAENVHSKIETMAFYGVPPENISLVLGIDINKYAVDYAKGKVKAKLLAGELLLNLALQGDASAVMALSKDKVESSSVGQVETLSAVDLDEILRAADYE